MMRWLAAAALSLGTLSGCAGPGHAPRGPIFRISNGGDVDRDYELRARRKDGRVVAALQHLAPAHEYRINLAFEEPPPAQHVVKLTSPDRVSVEYEHHDRRERRRLKAAFQGIGTVTVQRQDGGYRVDVDVQVLGRDSSGREHAVRIQGLAEAELPAE